MSFKNLQKYQEKLNGIQGKYQEKRKDSTFMKYGKVASGGTTEANLPPIEVRPLNKIQDPHNWAPPPRKGGDPSGPYQPQFANSPQPGQPHGQPVPGQPQPPQPVPGQPYGQPYGQPVYTQSGQLVYAQPGVPAQPGQPVYGQPGHPGVPQPQPQYGQPGVPTQPYGQPPQPYAQPPQQYGQPSQQYGQSTPQPHGQPTQSYGQPAPPTLPTRSQPAAPQPAAPQPVAPQPASTASTPAAPSVDPPAPVKRPVVDPHSFAPPPPARSQPNEPRKPHISRRPDRQNSTTSIPSPATTPATTPAATPAALPASERPPAYSVQTAPAPPARAVPAPPPATPATPALTPSSTQGRPPKPKPAKPKPAVAVSNAAMPDIDTLRNRMAAMGLKEMAPEPIAEPVEDYSQPNAGKALESTVVKKPKPTKPKPAKPGLQSKSASPAPVAAPIAAAAPAPPLSRPAAVPPQPVPALTPAPAPAPASSSALELETLWFTKPLGQLTLPAAFAGKSYTCQGAANSHKETLKLNVREPDLRVVRISLEWPPHDPSQVQVDRQEGFPPRPLTNAELVQSHVTYGDRVAAWSEQQQGRRVGDGECWTLAKEALSASGALPSQGYVHGAQVLCQQGKEVKYSYDMMRRGDIVQFESARFVAGATGLHHTSVICSVDHSKLSVVEQNVQGSPVQYGQYDLAEMQSGELIVYRPVSESWIEPF